ncbi:MAG TPA: hypothetical protein VM348_06290, partial [Brevundimonas sp.]|nr:hypothetical protein [Brevundimonas sp.]
AGRLIGEQAAAAAMAAGGIDPAIAQTPYRPVTRPGQWISTPLPQIEPFMSAFRPWAIPSAEALRPPPPPALDSAAWPGTMTRCAASGVGPAPNGPPPRPWRPAIVRPSI